MVKPMLGLVTVLFNSDDVLDGFFRSLSLQSFKDYQLYLIDNTPNDKSDLLIDELTVKYGISNFTHLRNTENVGVAKGNNQGIELSLKVGTSYTLLLNNDIEFEQPDLLQGLINRAVKNQESLIVPKILFYDSKLIWTAGGKHLKFRATTKHIGEGEPDTQIYNQEKYVDYAPTCFMLIDNKVFQKVGLMDERYFVYYDDTDFIYRAVKLGYKVLYLPEYVVLHKVGSLTGGDESLFNIYWGTRNRIYFIRKNYGFFWRVMAISFTLLWKGIKCTKYSTSKREKTLAGIRDGFRIQSGQI
jgi:GT2 family glycosyltransferase